MDRYPSHGARGAGAFACRRSVYLIAALAVLMTVLSGCSSSAPEVPFAKVTRETIVATIKTNGTVQPIEWTAVRASREGTVSRILVEKGQQVQKGALIVELDAGSAQADLEAARASYAQAKTDLDMLEAGGREADRVAIASDVESAQAELEPAREELAALKRLADRNAATREQVDQAASRVQSLELRIAALERKREALVSPTDLRDAERRMAGAQASIDAALQRISQARITAPIGGDLYRLEVRAGDYLNPGALVAEIGVLDRVRAVIYVDEPELGSVAVGMPVEITWDALPGQTWDGTIERVPTRIAELGTRQVGEVTAIIDNPDHDIPPGANINAEIRSRVAENVLAIPKEALRRQGTDVGVYVLRDSAVEWVPVKIGASSLTHAEVSDGGLSEGDAVALPAETQLENGVVVKPVFE